MRGEYNGFEFWAYDVSLSILLAEMARTAEGTGPQETGSRLAALLPELRVHAVVGADFGLPLDKWVAGHEGDFVALVNAACVRLAARAVITAEDAAGWQVLDGHTVLWREHDQVSTGPITALGEALVKIIQGSHPPAPAGRQWYFGIHGADGPTSTIRTRSEASDLGAG
ncbi:hypothetical protein ACFWY9_11105 [Amycolatopsis sp. NPDC059027]|uniref:hypothetical protein n=1 Tax=Amycolatopsis sp. NPDC059027 TaxID=3346709 RepID=UPI00366B464B